MSRGSRRDAVPPGGRVRAGRSARSVLELLLLFLLFLPAAFEVRAGEDAEAPSAEEVRAQAEALLRDLRSPEFAVREAARKGLIALGPQVPELLERHRDDEDPEVRRTVRLLLERLGRDEPEEARPPPGDLEALGRVSLRAKGTVRFLLDTLSAGRSTSFLSPEDVGSGWVEVELEDVPFFEALETIAKAGGLAARAPFDAAGRMTLTWADPADLVPSSAAGPMRVTLAEVTSIRTLGAEAGRRYVVGLDLHWLPSVQLTQRRTPRDLVAVDAQGRGFKPGGAMQDTTWGYSPSARSVRIDVELEPDDPQAIEHLEELSFTLPVRLQHDRQEIVFTGLADLELPVTRELPRTPGAGVDRVTLRAVDRPDGEQGPLVVDVLTQLQGKTAAGSLAIVLMYEDGTAQPASTGSRFPSADGTLGLRARAWGRREELPVAIRVTWFRVEEEGKLAFTLSGVPLR